MFVVFTCPLLCVKHVKAVLFNNTLKTQSVCLVLVALHYGSGDVSMGGSLASEKSRVLVCVYM